MQERSKRHPSESRLRRFCAATLFALVLAVCIVELNGSGQEGFLSRGDFPAFYSAAEIALGGATDELYSLEAHRRIQNIHWPELHGSVLPFAYPPWFALLLSPLALLSAEIAKYCFTILQFFLLGISVRLFLLVMQDEPWFSKILELEYIGNGKTLWLLLVTLSLCFAPLLCGALAGQNTVLSLLCVSILFYSFGRGEGRSEVLAGVAAGLWLFKPHFAAPVIILLLLLRRFRSVVAATFVGLLYGILAAAYFGPRTFSLWLRALKEFSSGEFSINGHQIVSLLGSASAFGLGGASASLYYLVAAVASALFAYLLAVRFGKDCLELRSFNNVVPFIVLLSPHTMFYDVGICALAFWYVFLRRLKDSAVLEKLLWLTLLLLSLVIGGMRESFSWSPFVAYPLLLLLFLSLQEATAVRKFDAKIG